MLRGHFGGKDEDLARALQSLWRGLEGCHQILSTSTHQVGGSRERASRGLALHGHLDPDPTKCGLAFKGVWKSPCQWGVPGPEKGPRNHPEWPQPREGLKDAE